MRDQQGTMITYIIVCIITLSFTTVLTIAGLGAAFILIPVFLALGFPLLTAMSTALLLNTIAMVIASVSYGREKLIVFKTAIPIALAALVFSPLGASVAKYLPENILKSIFICFLIFAASMIIFYKPKEKQQKIATTEIQEESAAQEIAATEMDHESAGQEIATTEMDHESAGQENDTKEMQYENSARKLIGYGITIGTGAGFLGGLLGVGGGNFIVPVLIFLGFEAKKAAATTAFIVIFSSFSGFLAHVSLGTIDLRLLLFCAVGSISGAILGSQLMKKKLSARQVKIAIGIVLYIVAANMIYNLLTSGFAVA